MNVNTPLDIGLPVIYYDNHKAYYEYIEAGQGMGMDKNDFALKTCTVAAYEFNHKLADKLHVSDDQMFDIVAGRIKVQRVIFETNPTRGSDGHARLKHNIKRCCVAAMAVLLVLLLSVQGLVDSFRESFLRIFSTKRAVHVETVLYDRTADLQGYIVPSRLPRGYVPDYHSTSSNNILYMKYKNEEGQNIEYYFYPQGATASYDNERAKHHVLDSTYGTVHVWQADSGHTTAYLLIEDAYAQMDFDGSVTDAEIRQIINGLYRVD